MRYLTPRIRVDPLGRWEVWKCTSFAFLSCLPKSPCDHAKSECGWRKYTPTSYDMESLEILVGSRKDKPK